MGHPAPWLGRISPTLLLLLLLGTGCATTRGFVPVAAATARGPDGAYTAAEYSLGSERQSHAEVRVWSRGAYREDAQDEARTVVHVGFEVKNHGATPLQLDPQRLFLEDVVLPDDALYQLAPARVEGNSPVPSGATVKVDAYFELPSGIRPHDVASYRVAWSIEGGERPSAEHTAFRSPSLRWRWYPSDTYYPGVAASGWYYPWPGYPYYGRYPYYGPYSYWLGAPGFRNRVYGPRVLSRPRVRVR